MSGKNQQIGGIVVIVCAIIAGIIALSDRRLRTFPYTPITLALCGAWIISRGREKQKRGE
jgi:hypothetical protein